MSCMNRPALFTSIAAVAAFSPLQQYADLSCCKSATEAIAEKKRSHRRQANTFKEVPTTGTDSVQLLEYKKIDEPETWASYPIAKPQLFSENVPLDYRLASIKSYTAFLDWSVGRGCNKRCDVRFRCYYLDERDPKTLWNDICEKTGNLASYGYVDGKRLYVIFMKGGLFKDDNMACGFDTEMLARFNILGWTSGNPLVLKAQDATGRTVAIKAFPAINEWANCSNMLWEWYIMRTIRGMPNVSQPLSCLHLGWRAVE